MEAPVKITPKERWLKKNCIPLSSPPARICPVDFMTEHGFTVEEFAPAIDKMVDLLADGHASRHDLRVLLDSIDVVLHEKTLSMLRDMQIQVLERGLPNDIVKSERMFDCACMVEDVRRSLSRAAPDASKPTRAVTRRSWYMSAKAEIKVVRDRIDYVSDRMQQQYKERAWTTLMRLTEAVGQIDRSLRFLESRVTLALEASPGFIRWETEE